MIKLLEPWPPVAFKAEETKSKAKRLSTKAMAMSCSKESSSAQVNGDDVLKMDAFCHKTEIELSVAAGFGKFNGIPLFWISPLRLNVRVALTRAGPLFSLTEAKEPNSLLERSGISCSMRCVT